MSLITLYNGKTILDDDTPNSIKLRDGTEIKLVFAFQRTSLQVKLPSLDQTKYVVKYPAKITLGTDILLKLRKMSDHQRWMIPVHKDFLDSEIPYF